MTAARDLDAIFERSEASLPRDAPPLVARTGTVPDKRDVLTWSEKDVEIEGRKGDEVLFADLIVQKRYVGFHFMPVYGDTDEKRLFAPRLLGLLRGKSCFHVRELDDELLEAVDGALEQGVALYREHGWI